MVDDLILCGNITVWGGRWQIHVMLMRLNSRTLNLFYLLKSYSVWKTNVKKSAILSGKFER